MIHVCTLDFRLGALFQPSRRDPSIAPETCVLNYRRVISSRSRNNHSKLSQLFIVQINSLAAQTLCEIVVELVARKSNMRKANVSQIILFPM